MAAKKTTRKKVDENIINSVQNLQSNDVVDEIGKLQVSLQGTLSGISAAITGKIEQMHSVDLAIEAKENKLKELFDLEDELLTIEEARTRRDEEQLKWDKLKAEELLKYKEECDSRTKNWQREAEEYSYKIKQQRQREKEEFETEVLKTKRAEEIRIQELNRDWAEREAALQSKEEEFASLKEKVANFDIEMNQAVEKARNEGYSTASAKFHTQIQIMQKEHEAERNIDASKIIILENTVEDLKNQVKALYTQLSEARQDAKEVTAAALESASGRNVAEALSKVVGNNSQTTSVKK